ncbi:enoyl-CoA hydratase/isomerase family protein (plasmid) [Sphingomonas paeninsulae]|jgi:enoyl-CoA hydratase|uniref:Enoyl-CoA hydratase/isomerase family protein n=1 Tax=Sphingomonas paeninsulae TaxID=2319844 RepID=A0A494T7R3_SPHPE|nr:enoyl-CoA hydratase/isomerase family protein [Sphingomonas paeninsulae]AYJ85389.1 enoyl-CoA hydratase/isomerase family protein [Sphingomonas paeninsulae]
MTEETPPLVLRDDAGGVTTLTLNRPEKRNALNVDLFVALDAHLSAIEQETDTVGVVVLRANGPVFSAGADLGKQQRAPVKNFQGLTIERLANLPQPVIAAVHGPCFTGGLELVLAADIIVAAESARFADTHAKWGLVPGWGMSQRLPRRVGVFRAREMMFTTRAIDGRTAEQIGLANLCVADDAFEAELASLVADIVGLSWHSHRGNKRLSIETAGMELAQGLAHESYRGPGIAPDFAERVGSTFGKR